MEELQRVLDYLISDGKETLKKENSSVTFQEIIFYAFLDDGEVIRSSRDSVLQYFNRIDKIIFHFRINYSLKTASYSSYSSPIILYKNERFCFGGEVINDWHFTYKGQNLIQSPHPLQVKLSNDVLEYENTYNIDFKDFGIFFKMASSIIVCDSKMEAYSFWDKFQENVRLELLKKRIQELEIENHIKDSFNKGYLERIGELETALLEQKDNEIDSYKGILNGIKELLK